jgi:pilus assembly protein CpaE
LTARAQPLDRKAALAAGADAYLSKPVSARTLIDRVQELAARARPKQAGQVVVLLSLRGGVGVTTLAVNLAALLQRAPQGACLVDLNPAGGHVALHLKLTPAAHWGALLQESEVGGQGSVSDALTRDPRSLTPELLTRHASGLHVLAAPPDVLQGQSLERETARVMLRTLRERFSFTIIDAAPILDGATVSVLSQADSVLLVFAPEISAVYSAGIAMKALAGTPVESHVSLVMNHPSPLRPLPQATVEHSLGRAIALSVPFDENQILALARGVPLATQPATGGIGPLVKAVRDLAVHVAGFRLQTADLKAVGSGQ